ncbi:hypothetical protein [Paenibacillus sp.]|uniref:hypothetical protein n=1 Tax=Paenibacillus sp. TaxID=58172 RepID=UPI002812727A|nr:hypothetical protein [Paenibacillus sp.]
MSAYIHGSLALDERRSQSADPGNKRKPDAKKEPRAKTISGAEKLAWIGLVFFVCGVAGIYQFREASKYEMNAEIVKMEREIRALEDESAKLKNEVARLGSPERLIEMGIQLGLAEQGSVPAAQATNGTAVALGAAE